MLMQNQVTYRSPQNILESNPSLQKSEIPDWFEKLKVSALIPNGKDNIL